MAHRQYENLFAPEADLLTIGKVTLPTGRVVVCDPFFCGDATCLSREVPPGEYDVQLRNLASELGQRIALARLVIRPNESATSFEMATYGADDSGHFFVNSGLASYMDERTRVAFADLLSDHYRKQSHANYYDDVLAQEFKKNAVNVGDPLDAGAWNLHRLPGAELNVAIFASGLGDGAYQSWWGLANSGEIVSLVTDFGLLDGSGAQ